MYINIKSNKPSDAFLYFDFVLKIYNTIKRRKMLFIMIPGVTLKFVFLVNKAVIMSKNGNSKKYVSNFLECFIILYSLHLLYKKKGIKSIIPYYLSYFVYF